MCEEDRAGRRKGRKEERGRIEEDVGRKVGKKEAMGRKKGGRKDE